MSDREDIVVDESGTPNPVTWTGCVSELGSDYEAVQFHATRNLIQVQEHAGQVILRGRHRTGVILLPSGRRIVLRTKLTGITLLDWLAYLGEFPNFQSWSLLGNVSPQDNWQQVLLQLFLSELDLVTRWHVRKDFIKQKVVSSQVRGRILAGALAQRVWQLPLLPQEVRGRSFDTPANRMLAAALKQVTLFQRDLDSTSLKLLFSLRDEWAVIAGDDVDRHRVAADGFTTAPSDTATHYSLPD